MRRIDWAVQALLFLAMFAIVVLGAHRAHAHDEWANGKPIPAWVKASCCGPADAHHLTPNMVHGPMSAGEAYALRPAWGAHPGDSHLYYVVDGYGLPVRYSEALPSQDGDYWIFYRDEPSGENCSPEGGCSGTHPASQSGVYCFFVPMEF